MNETLSKLWDTLLEASATAGLRILLAIAVLIVGLLLIKYLVKFIVKSKGFNKIDVTVQTFLKSALAITLKVLLIISVIGILGVPLTSIIAVLASAGLAIGLALQGALSNFAGGIMILVFRPFKVGDFVDNGTHMGYVDSITIFYTRLLTKDNKLVTVPNSTMTTASITNFSAKELRRVDIEYKVSYKNDIDKVKSVLTSVAEKHPLVLKDPAVTSGVYAHGPNSLVYVLRAWCKADDYWTVYFDMNENVKKSFDEQGIEIPLQQVVVDIKDKNK